MSFTKTGGKRKQYKKKGGMGASGYGTYFWGNGSQQHSISPNTNVIAGNPAVVAGAYRGGNGTSVSNPGYTGGDITTIGVPALLIAANQLYKPKRRTFKRKVMRGGADDQMSQMMQQSMQQSMDSLKEMNNPTLPAVVQNSANMQFVPPANIQVFKGGETKKLGAGILTDIAVPAILLTANHLYKRKSKKSKSSKKNKRSRKVSFKLRYAN